MSGALSQSDENWNKGDSEKRVGEEDLQRMEAFSAKGNFGIGFFQEPLMRSLRFVRYDKESGITPASLVLSFMVTKDLCNDFETLHGGAQATAVDLFTSILLSYVHRVPSVTADLHVSCISAAPLGSTVICLCKADKHGGRLQFSSCDLYNVVTKGSAESEKRRILVAKGLHTKYVLKKRFKGFDGERQRSKL